MEMAAYASALDFYASAGRAMRQPSLDRSKPRAEGRTSIGMVMADRWITLRVVNWVQSTVRLVQRCDYLWNPWLESITCFEK